MNNHQILVDALPCVALLLRPYSREIVAANRTAVEGGALPGCLCYAAWQHRPTPCPWCRAPQLWQTGEAQETEFEANGVIWDTHWIPVSRDVYMHYAFAVTEHKKLEDRLKRAEKMEALGVLAGGVAHDLNNILGAVIGFSELTLLDMEETDPHRKNVGEILRAGRRAALIIQDLLTLARRGVMVSEVVNLNRIIAGSFQTKEYEQLRTQFPEVDFQTDLSRDLLNIRGSAFELKKAILSLVTNGAEAQAGKGTVMVKSENRCLDRPLQAYDSIQPGEYAVLQVSDTGAGLAEEQREKIFEPFYTRKAMGRNGTGLGLAVVWGTVKEHGGYIEVESPEGQGTIFTLYFPAIREEAPDGQPVNPDLKALRSRGEKILVVDDVREQRVMAESLLKKMGYDVRSVPGGEEAVAYVQENRVDLLVLDMIMDPGMDGLETYRRIREINPDQRAIIVSGFSESKRVREAQRLGAGEYVPKPYVLEKLARAIRKELDRSA